MTENDQPRRGSSRDSTLIVGGVLIAAGIVLLLRNWIGFAVPFNWWGLFILIPAFGSLLDARRAYQTDGRFTRAVQGRVFGGAVLLFVAIVLSFDLDWGKLWPVFLIIGGLGALLTALRAQED